MLTIGLIGAGAVVIGSVWVWFVWDDISGLL